MIVSKYNNIKIIFLLSFFLLSSCHSNTKESKNSASEKTTEISKDTVSIISGEDSVLIKEKALGDSLCKIAENNMSKPITNADLEEVNKNFNFRGAYINPKLVFLFIQWLNDDKPPVMSIDIAATNVGTNQFYSDVAPYKTTTDYVVLEDKESGSIEYYSYKWLGMLNNQIHVLQCVENSSNGSGQFINLLFVRFNIAKYNMNGEIYNQLLMNNISVYFLGDRTETNIKLDKNNNLVKLQYNNSNGKLISETIKP